MEIINFDSVERPPDDGNHNAGGRPKSNLRGYNRNLERWLSLEKRTQLTDSSKCIPTTRYMYNTFVSEIKKLAEDKLINLSCFPNYWETDIKYKDYELPVTALDEINNLPYEVQVNMIINMISNAHDGWIKDNAADFFGYYMGLEYLYLPIEIAGEEVFLRYYEILEKRLSKLGLDNVDYGMIREAYLEKQRKMLINNKITSSNELANLVILIGKHNKKLCKPIANSLSRRSKAYEIANQILYRSPELLDNFHNKKVTQ